MPRLQTALTLGIALLCPAVVRAQHGQSGTPNWPPPAYQRPSEGVMQASHNAPIQSAPAPTEVNVNVAPLPPRRDEDTPLPLAARGRSKAGEASSGAGGALLTTAGSLALVLCLFFAAAWLLRRGTPHSLAVLPGEVVEILGRAALPGRHQMHLVRCGHKLLLVSVSAAGADMLTEITDSLEVERLCGLCREAHPQSSTVTFRKLLDQFGSEPAIDSRARRKLRASGEALDA